MYFLTLSRLVSLTETAKYSSCQPNFILETAFLLIQKDDSPFDQPHYLLKRLICPKGNQAMNVVDISADEIDMNALHPRILANVLKHIAPDFIVEERLAVLCRPNKVDPDSHPRHVSLAKAAKKIAFISFG